MVVDKLLRDVRYGLRMSWKNKGFSAIVVLTLALALGASTTISTMLNAVYFNPLPIAEPDQVAFVWMTNPELNRMRSPLSLPDFEDLRAELTTFDDLAAITDTTFSLTGLDEPARVRGYLATSNFFSLMGIPMRKGRSFSDEETSPSGSRVALLSHGSWERRFGSDPNILGKRLFLDGESYEIVGVVSPDLEYGAFRDVEIWTALNLDTAHVGRDQRNLRVPGRLKSGVTLEQARAELASVSERLAQEHPITNGGWTSFPQSLTEVLLGKNARRVLTLFIMTMGFVLFIACANVANLLAARAATRRQEMALRTALGADRSRLMRQLLTESLLLSIVAAGLGVLLAHVTLELLVSVTRGRVPFFAGLTIDGNVLLFTSALAFLAPVIFGLLPALRTSQARFTEDLKEAAGRASVGFRRLSSRKLLVAGEVALALVLMVVAGLALRTIIALGGLELGFEPGQVLTSKLELPTSKYQDETRMNAFFDELLERTGAVAGVSGASLVSHLPIEGGEPLQPFVLAGKPRPEPGHVPVASVVSASAGFFPVFRIPLLEGRSFSELDTATSPKVAVINRAAVERYWPAAQPIGDRVRLNPSDPQSPWIEIVGISGNLRNPDADQPTEPAIYIPLAQRPVAGVALALRTELEPLSIAGAVRREIRASDPDQPVYDIRSMEQVVYDDFAGDYATIGLLASFTLIALGLAIAGVYGIISFTASQRSHEIGIRLALGARATQILEMMLAEGLTPVLLGIGAGLAGAYALSRGMTSMVFGVSTSDPLTFVGTSLTLAAAAMAASLLPASRAARTDPTVSLRHQ